MFALIAEHESSTMIVKDFCELYDLSPGTYHYWQKKYHARFTTIQPCSRGTLGGVINNFDIRPYPALNIPYFPYGVGHFNAGRSACIVRTNTTGDPMRVRLFLCKPCS